MAKYQVAVCRSCLRRLGVTFEEYANIPTLYCAACEPSQAHKEEVREKEIKRYREAISLLT